MLLLNLVNLTCVILFFIVLSVFLSTVQSLYNALFDYIGMNCVINELCCKVTILHRGSYRSAHVLLNLLNKLGKRDKMRGLQSILSLSQRV